MKCRRSREPPLGQEPPDLELRVLAGLDPAEQLQHVPVVDERQAVALIAAASRPFPLGRQLDRGANPRAAQAAARRGDLPLRRHHLQQPLAHVIVLHAVDDGAFARAGDPGQHQRGRVLHGAPRVLA